MTKISVIMPVYNTKGEYLQQAIDSVINQTDDMFEFIIINDGSTAKDTLEVLNGFGHYVTIEKNSGIGIARNAGVDLADGDYICFLSADDLWHPTFIEEMRAAIELHGENFYFSGVNFIDENGDLIEQDTRCSLLHSEEDIVTFDRDVITNEIMNFVVMNDMFTNYDSVMIPKKYCSGEFNFGDWRMGEDLFHLLKIVHLSKLNFVYVNKRIVNYRMHPEQGIRVYGHLIAQNNIKIVNEITKLI